MKKELVVSVVGAGLAGCSAAFELARMGIRVNLFEMRPALMTEAHKTGKPAELVCSNSLKSKELSRASGLLKTELEMLDCEMLKIAYENSIPGGKALVVDREGFADAVDMKLKSNPLVTSIVEEITDFSLEKQFPVIYATGPLTSEKLLKAFQERFSSALFFYDAIAPSVLLDSLDTKEMFWGSRNQEDCHDYLNIPLSKEEYLKLYSDLLEADTIAEKPFEKKYFEICLPVEELARRGVDTLRFGPLKPVGFNLPRKPYAVIQLRREDKAGKIMGMVGFQTRLSYKSQKKVFSGIRGFENAEFIRLGSLHKNSYLNSPDFLDDHLRLKTGQNVWFAGQIAGSEGYTEAIALGLAAGKFAGRRLLGNEIPSFPDKTIIGSLIKYITEGQSPIKPMQANWGLLEEMNMKDKKKKYEKYANESICSLKEYINMYFR
ncbi:MAG: methylenetetrahydrofolate--tRNA-(uracil(54)-C(5))-methyltransferase (FADH(2)-oxidizing) TrmFO [Candidatus Coatesbacteria bacterium]|nr:methylenetetrahydrofolate--tRNA-(uracil(54)-C(5))-methyltransferase (FADH(2)-oxidizing) TrmFO [Candidatus Coatesbacteria bacterium]